MDITINSFTYSYSSAGSGGSGGSFYLSNSGYTNFAWTTGSASYVSANLHGGFIYKELGTTFNFNFKSVTSYQTSASSGNGGFASISTDPSAGTTGTLSISNCNNLQYSSASLDGGLFYFGGSSSNTITITSSAFQYCSASQNGGVFSAENTGTTSFTMTSVALNYNSASQNCTILEVKDTSLIGIIVSPCRSTGCCFVTCNGYSDLPLSIYDSSIYTSIVLESRVFLY